MAYAAFSTAYTPEPTSCASGPKPGAVALQRWACDESPWGADLWDVGIYACRDVYGGWCPNCNRSALSAHASGRAGDSAHNIINGRSHPSGKAFAAWLVRNHAVLGVQEVISDYQRWTNQTREWRAYTGRSPHTDHVHWALNTSGGTYLTRGRILSVAPGQTAPKGTDMAYIVTCSGQPDRLKDGPTCPTIGTLTKTNAVKAGIPVINHSLTDYRALLAHVEDALGR
jgi:hypothetical protein